ncbi:MAG TPA: translocation/assembly module TamB domain-containing protein, partial [Kofleriaceae bacterium]|nr:translocation/assembly module TamB domain-containing protein [Kofleriaceae bacterium]
RLELDAGLGAIWRTRAGALARTEISGRLEAPAIPLRRLVAIFGVGEPVTGSLRARADLSGTLGDPAVEGTATLTGAEWRTNRLDTASLSGRWRRGAWTAAVHALQSDRGELRASMSGNPRRAAEGQLWARGLDLGVLSPMLRAARLPIYRIDGKLAANLRLRDQSTTGTLTVRNGSLRMTTGLRRVSHLDLTVDFRDRDLTLTARGRTGNGTLHVDGTAALPADGLLPERVNLVAHLDDSPVLAGGIRGTASGEIRLEGTRRDQLWRVDVAVSDGRLRLPADFRGRKLHPMSALEDVRYANDIRAARTRGPVAQASTPVLRARVRTTEPIRIRSKGELEARAVADLEVTLLDGATVVSGEVELTRGSMTLFDQQYRVSRAALQFQGRSPPDPDIDVRLEHGYEQGVTLYIDVTGTLQKPRVDLSSDPASYSRGELLGFVLGGQPGAAPRSEGSLQSGALSAASGLLAGRLEGLLRQRAPFDTIRLGTESSAQSGVSYVTVGRWISDDLFVAYHRRFDAEEDENANEALLEYQLSKRWTLRGAAGDRGAAHVDLLWVKRYD